MIIILLTILSNRLFSCTIELDGKTIIHIKKKDKNKDKTIAIVDTTKITIDTTKTEQDPWEEMEIKN
jgi:hypothetical protein